MAISNSSPAFDNGSPFEGLSKELLSHLPGDSEIWSNLKEAIAASSGFQRWRLEHGSNDRLNGLSLDMLVRTYLRETLETLAY